MTGYLRQLGVTVITLLITILAVLAAAPAHAVWYSDDGSLEVRGFFDSSSYFRRSVGLTKQRFQGQLEFAKDFRPSGFFSSFSVAGTLRASYDAVYDINGHYGDNAGGPLVYSAPLNPAFFASLPGGGGFDPTTTPNYAGIFGPPVISPGTAR